MRYTIGEVADILNISRDMVRYYEKQGVIRSERNASNNYRTYDISVIFWLLEALQFKNLGINIRDITNVRSGDYDDQMVRHLESRIRAYQEELDYRVILIRRLRQLKDRLSLGRHNIGNYWVSRVPAHYICHLVDGIGDDYQKISMSDKASRLVFSDRINPFTDSTFQMEGNVSHWEISLDEDYVQGLALELSDDFTYVPEMLCFCTHIDMGDMGDYHPKMAEAFKLQALKHNPGLQKMYCNSDQPNAAKMTAAVDTADTSHIPLHALLVNRGYEEGKLHRILELRIPLNQ